MAKKKNYDSDFCGSLPLHHINVIQNYGYLLVIDNDYRIIQISENLPELLNTTNTEIIGNKLEAYIEIDSLKELGQRFTGKSKEKLPLSVLINGQKLFAVAHFRDNYTILELEKPEFANERSFTNVYAGLKYAMAAIESSDDIIEVSKIAVSELKKITGFDGIMMYQFDSDWNGTVIAQEKSDPALEDYMGHTFPASDIPRQARELYLKNPYRLIPQRDYQPIKLYPVVNSSTNSFIDLSDCNLRGVAAVHLEYLKNMNVESSMSIRVIHEGRLWGLIACHHVSPHYLNFELCSICELLSTVISNRISAILAKERFSLERTLQEHQTAIIAEIYAKNDIVAALINNDHTSLLNMFHSDGMAIYLNGKLNSMGSVPDHDTLDNLMLWLQTKQIEKVFVTDQLPALFDEILPFAELASGALVIPVSARKGEYIICFRPELIYTIKWGGNPNEALTFEPNSTKYHPRASFKIWQQTVQNTSSPWNEFEIKAADNLRSFVYEYITKN